MREIKITENEKDQRIDKFLRKYMSKAPLGFIYKMIRKKNIKVNQKRVQNDYMLKIEDTIQLYLKEDTIEGYMQKKEIKRVHQSFKVVYEDEHILLVGKPQGLLVHEDAKEKKNTLINQVITYLYDQKEYDPNKEKTFIPATVNRLDRNTSGMVLVGKDYESVKALNQMIRQKGWIKKYYITLVKGVIDESKELKGYLFKDGEKNIVKITDQMIPKSKFIHTRYKPIKNNGQYTLLQVEILTGRSHQIRAHLSSIGHPIVGDFKYGDQKVNQKFKNTFGLKSQYLHAKTLIFSKTTQTLKYLQGKKFECNLPYDLEKIKVELFS